MSCALHQNMEGSMQNDFVEINDVRLAASIAKLAPVGHSGDCSPWAPQRSGRSSGTAMAATSAEDLSTCGSKLEPPDLKQGQLDGSSVTVCMSEDSDQEVGGRGVREAWAYHIPPNFQVKNTFLELWQAPSILRRSCSIPKDMGSHVKPPMYAIGDTLGCSHVDTGRLRKRKRGGLVCRHTTSISQLYIQWVADAVASLYDDGLPAEYKMLQRRLQEHHPRATGSFEEWRSATWLEAVCLAGNRLGLLGPLAPPKAGSHFTATLSHRELVTASAPRNEKQDLVRYVADIGWDENTYGLTSNYNLARYLRDRDVAGLGKHRMGDVHALVCELIVENAIGRRRASGCERHCVYLVPFSRSDECRKLVTAQGRESTALLWSDLQRDIHILLEEKKECLMSTFSKNFQRRFGYELDYRLLGFVKLKPFLEHRSFAHICKVICSGTRCSVRVVSQCGC